MESLPFTAHLGAYLLCITTFLILFLFSIFFRGVEEAKQNGLTTKNFFLALSIIPLMLLIIFELIYWAIYLIEL